MAMGPEQSYVGHVGHIASMEDTKSEARLPTSASRSLRRARTVMGTEEDFAEVLAENHDLVEQLRELQLENERLRYEKEREQSDPEYEEDVVMPDRIEKHRSSTGVRFALSKTETISSSMIRRFSSIGGDGRGRPRNISEDAVHSVGRLKSDSISPGSDRSELEAQLAEMTRQYQELGRSNDATREREGTLATELQEALKREQQASAQVKHLSESLEECHQLIENLKEQVKKSEEDRNMDLSQSMDGGAATKQESMLRGLERSTTSLALELGDDDSDEDSALPSARSRVSTGSEKQDLREKLESITSENITLHNQIREHQEAIHLLEKQVANANLDAYRGEVTSLNEKAIASLKDAHVPTLHLPHAVDTMSTQSSPCPSPRSLEAELESLRKRLAERDQEVSQLKKQVEDQARDHKQEQKASEEVEVLRKSHEAETEALKTEVKQRDEQVSQLRKEVEDHASALQKDHTTSQEIESLRTSHEAEMEALRKEVAQRDEQVAQLKKMVEDQASSLSKDQTATAELDAASKSLEAEVEALKKEVAQRDEQVSQLKKQVEDQNDSLKKDRNASEEVEVLRESHEAEIETLKKDMAQQNEQAAATSSEEARKLLESHEAQLKDSQKLLAVREAEVASLKKAQEEQASTSAKEIEELRQTHQAELGGLKKLLSERDEEVSQLKRRAAESASDKEKEAEAKVSPDALEDLRRAHEAEVEAFKKSLADKELEAQVESLKKTLDERDQEVKALRQQTEELKAHAPKAESLQQELLSMKQSREALEKELAERDEQAIALKKQVAEAAGSSPKAEVDGLKRSLAEREQEVGLLKKRMEEQHTNTSSSNPNDAGSSADQSSHLHEKEASLEEANNNLKSVEAELDNLRSRLVERDQEVGQLKKKVEDQAASQAANNAQEGQQEKKADKAADIPSEEFERLRQSYIKEVQNRKKLQKQVLEMKYVIQSERENGGWFNKMFGMMCVSGREAAPIDADDASEKGSASPSDQGRQLKLQGAD